MAYTYSDYITLDDPTAKRVRLRLHIQEISDLITADVTKGGSSRSVASLQTYLDSLRRELKSLDVLVARKGGKSVGFANLNNAR